MAITNVPGELRERHQWVCAGPDKIPINPLTLRRADPANPSTGARFDDAVSAGMAHVGYILSAADPYTVIDLDNPFEDKHKRPISDGHPLYSAALAISERHKTIYNAFDTYAEISQSGRGAHIVAKGQVPRGVRRDKVEIYARDRYIIFTGNVLKGADICDCQQLLDTLFSQVSQASPTAAAALVEVPPAANDAKIWQRAAGADNGEKFRALCNGEWRELSYPSQSEADHALVAILAYYTRSNEQVRRMMRTTKLGQRAKAQKSDVYLDRSLARIRASESPLVDMSGLQAASPSPPAALASALAPLDALPAGGYTFPPGLVGEVAAYILAAAKRPVAEIALAGALAFCAGICGRAYNISEMGLNQYIIVLADTGRGKEGAAAGIDKLISAVGRTVPMVDQFVGPAAFASGQALVKALDTQPCFMSVLGEVGVTFQQMLDSREKGPLLMLKKVLLDVYIKSGFERVLRPTVYSSIDNNTSVVKSPNVTLLGDATPSSFYDGLDASNILEGLLTRFTIIEYTGIRVPLNAARNVVPGPNLVSKLCQLATGAILSANSSTVCEVATDEAATKLLAAFDVDCDRRINAGGAGAEDELWSRAHLKSLKMAGLVAVGINPIKPAVTAAIAAWAIACVRRETGGVLKRFSAGDVGTGELKQEAEIRRLFLHFQNLTPRQRMREHRCPEGLVERQVATYPYFAKYSRRLSCFKNDRRGPTRALADTLAHMVKAEALEMLPPVQVQTEFGTRTAIYYPGTAW